jgi:hypothetical protein
MRTTKDINSPGIDCNNSDGPLCPSLLICRVKTKSSFDNANWNYIHQLEMEAKNTSSGLAVTQPNSPGSSVFDLPIQPTNPGTNTSNDASQRQFPIADVDRRDFLVGADQPSCVLISGGTGGNAICSAFVNACYILPVSDDGGSSSEIIRVLGGPSIGRHHHCVNTPNFFLTQIFEY